MRSSSSQLALAVTFFLFFLSFLFLAPPALANCYFPNGDLAQLNTPCTDATNHSSCCGQGYACLGLQSSYYLCQLTDDVAQESGQSQFVRGSCTDPTWRSGNCPGVCVNEDKPWNDITNGGEGVARCKGSETLFYCIDRNQDAVDCGASSNVIIFQDKPTVLTTIGVAPTRSASTAVHSTTGARATTSAGPPISSSTTTPTPTPRSNRSTLLGVTIGCTIGGFALAASAGVGWWFFWRRKRRAKRTEEEILGSAPPLPGTAAEAHLQKTTTREENGQGGQQQQQQHHEVMGSEGRVHEVSGEPLTHELPGDGLGERDKYR